MNIGQPNKIVVLGFLSHFPVAGVAWQTIHYLLGFKRLGFDVYYVEAHGCTPSKLMQGETDDGAARAASYIGNIMHRFDLDGQWAYDAIYESRCFGMDRSLLADLYGSAALIVNLHGSHLPREEWTSGNRLIYVGTDPVDIEIDVFHRKQEAIDYLRPHSAFFTFGENLGNPDCLVPVPEGLKFYPTRQPVVMEFWKDAGGGEASTFTTVGNWRQPWREIRYQGELYRWSKHLEFQKFIDLPSRVRQSFELALSSYSEKDQKLLESKGWRVRPALEVSRDLDAYRDYIGGSRGEFTVAKDQNVRLRSGWFSDRAATYLAAGRPVINQETGFSRILPTGKGLFAFSGAEEIIAAVETINADYEAHRRAARELARDYFSHEVVLPRLLDRVGVATRRPSLGLNRHKLPGNLVVVPVSRWPTRLPEESLQTALELPAFAASPLDPPTSPRTSVIIVTHNGLPYTKMCLASLLSSGWNPGDEVVIVDNGSTDGTTEFLRQAGRLNPFIEVLFNSGNTGFAKANNQAIQRASGQVLVFLNNDTIVLNGWKAGLAEWLRDPAVGMVGPVTNRTCNEAQVDAPYRTYQELEAFAREYTGAHQGQANDIPMLALFCAAIRREVLERVGMLDERFEVGMYEDDDYARRLREAGYRLLCAENVFVHHFGQASLGELCRNNQYDAVLEANRRRFEEKWAVRWEPHRRRLTAEYRQLRQRIQERVAAELPCPATILVVSKGDEELVRLNGRDGWHFPQEPDGRYSGLYPRDGDRAIAALETLRAKGAQYLLIPRPGFWWLEHYGELRTYLERNCSMVVRDPETCLIYKLGGPHG
jgi:GT2 family glycosyltransferase